MGLLRTVRNLARSLNIFHPAHDPHERTSHLRICSVESLETRRAMAVDPLHLGAVYYEDATGDDAAPDTIQVTYQGGAPGTQLTRIMIDGDKFGDGLTIGDMFWDISPGGKGSFGNSPFQIVSHEGMTITNISIADGGTMLIIDIQGWDAGEKLVFSLDVDEQGFASSTAVAEGGEFEGSILTGLFTNAHYEDLTATAIFYDYYDDEFATAAQQAGTTLNLPPDDYMPPDAVNREDRTAGAVVVAMQIPKPIELSGVVYHDRDQDVTQDAGEEGLAGVSLTLLKWNGTEYVSTGKTAVTDANGAYKFTGLLPGKYRVVETQPTGYLSTGSKAGTVLGATRGQTFGPDVLTEITLDGGENSIRNDFGEILPGSIGGKVWADPQGDCNFETGGIPLQGVVIELLDSQGNVIRTTTTDVNGKYSFDGLVPGSYAVREIQPSAYYNGGTHIGSAGGNAVAGSDLVTSIVLGSGVVGVNYDFCENLPASLSGRVWADPQGDCNFATGGIPLQGVVIELLDANGIVIRTTMTGADGTYSFGNLAPGVSYGVRELQPAGYFNAGTHVGSAGGNAVPGSDLITKIVLGSGVAAVNYDFCENLPASISGKVWADPEGDCNYETGAYPLEGVIIELLDANGVVIRTTMTDVNGKYEFGNLAPGTYSVHEIQPADYFNAGTHVGSAGGNAVAGSDRVTAIVLGSGVIAVNYDFCENIPAEISGSVWVDSNQNCKYEVGEKLLAGVKIDLLDKNGVLIKSTTTDVNGFYKFEGLPPGEYQIRENQPTGYYDACDHVGTEGGELTANDLIGKIVLGSGKYGQNYDFAEIEPAGIKGRVWADPQGDCNWATGGIPLAGVVIQLLDGNGTIIRTTLTGADGTYAFNDLLPGTYSVHEVQPAGYFNAGTHVGSAGGNAVPGSDTVTQIVLGSGVSAVDYDFCENLPASLAGKVWLETDDDRVFEAGETLLAGVKIELLDQNGVVIATQFTNSQGAYKFTGLQPGKIYAVRETQPTQYFQGGTLVGSSGGLAPFDDNIVQITLDSGEDAVNYDFSEIPKSTLSGYVFQDGPTIVLKDKEVLGDISQIRDGIRDAGDKPIAGVYMLLGDISGLPVLGEDGQPMVAITNADGYYEFTGLRAGIYTVRQIQPDDYIDGLDRPGSTSGYAFNPNSTIPLFVLAELSVNPGNDFIARINVPIGRASVENNFSEVLVRTETTPPLVIPPPVIPPPPLTYYYGNGIPGIRPEQLAQVLPEIAARETLVATNIRGNTWHLSVIDAGSPRTEREEESKVATVSMLNLQTWSNVAMDQATWTMATQDGSTVREFVFGNRQGLPVPGDYNGDGITEAGVYINGEWFIDLNNNGRWDKDDMWVKLGTEDDLPVVGDWDGDGKDDVGIYGPAWPRDPDAIRREPGLPVALNPPNGKNKNMPPLPEDAAVGVRSLKRSSTGKLRDDVIDHVFHYGTAGDHPLAGDWTGSGSDAIGVFREGSWNLDIDGNGRFDEHDVGVTFGQAGDLPVVGDWDGDGVDDLGVYRDGTFILDSDGNHTLDDTDLRVTIANAKAGGIPVAGDWDGDGRDEVGLYQPTTAAAQPTDR